MKRYIALVLILTLGAGFALAQAPEQILVVTADRLPTAISQTAASVTVLEKEELVAISSITPILRSTIGSQVRQQGGSASLATFGIRGSSASQVLFLVDGLPLATAQMIDQDLSIIPVEQIERIEILKGPASSLYGANAVGGVVNIITSKIEKPLATIELDANSFQTYQGRFLYQSWGEQFDWALAASGSKGQDHRKNSQFQKGNLWAKIQMPLSSMILTGTMNHFQDEKDIPSPYGAAGNQKDRQDRLTISLKGDSFSGNILYQDYWQQFDSSEHLNRALTLDGQSALTLATLPFLVGGDLAFDEAKSTNLGAETKQLLRGGIFIQQKSQLDLGLMRTGLRYDYHPSFGSYLSPSWNFLVPVNKEISAWVGIAKAFRAPSMNDLYWDDPVYNMYGNPDLKPETAFNGELGVRLIQGEQQLELVAFARKVQDLIRWLPTDDTFSEWLVGNQGNHLFYGFEATGTFKLSHGLSATCGYTLTEGKKLPEDTRSEYTPKHTVTGGLAFAAGQLTGQVHGQFQSEQTTGSFSPNLPSRFTAGCQLFYPVAQGKVTLKVDNITDVKYEEQAGYQMPPRNFTLSYQQNF